MRAALLLCACACLGTAAEGRAQAPTPHPLADLLAEVQPGEAVLRLDMVEDVTVQGAFAGLVNGGIRLQQADQVAILDLEGVEGAYVRGGRRTDTFFAGMAWGAVGGAVLFGAYSGIGCAVEEDGCWSDQFGTGLAAATIAASSLVWGVVWSMRREWIPIFP